MCVRIEQRNCQTTNIREILYLGFLLKMVIGLYNWKRICSLWGVRWQSKRKNGLQTRRQIRCRGQIPIIVQSSASQTFLLEDPFCLRKITTDPHTLAHFSTRSVNKVMRLIQYNSVLTFKLQIECPLQNSSLGRLHTSGDVVPTLRSNAGSR